MGGLWTAHVQSCTLRWAAQVLVFAHVALVLHTLDIIHKIVLAYIFLHACVLHTACTFTRPT